MVDTNSRFEYSKVINFKTDCNEKYRMEIYPNHSSENIDFVTIKLFTERTELRDVLGRKMKEVNLETVQDWNTMQVDVSSLPAGTYSILLEGNRRAKN